MIFEEIYDMQNLKAAWDRVRTNRPGPGIDRVRWEDFEANLLHNLHMLQKQIREEAYRPLPVTIFKEAKPRGKHRTIGLSSMRDKVVQQAVLLTIAPYFEKRFLPCCYAYRPRVSALSAIKRAVQCIAEGKLWVLKMDVERFFDTMDHTILLEQISSVVEEKPVIRLLSKLLKAKIFREMGLFDNLVGSQQGSGLSPLLSNIYLYPVDKELWSRYKADYLRYSDDVAIFQDEKEKLDEAQALLVECLGKVKLALNQSKTSITHVAAGTIYLGFYMDVRGKGPAKKSIDGLQTKLSEYDKLRKTDQVLEKLGAAKAVLRGWYNYYKTIKPVRPGNIISLVALVQLAKELGETSFARDLLKESKNFTHNHPEICFQLGELYAGFGMHNRAIREYARALELDPSLESAKEKVRKLQEGEENIHQAIEKIQLLLHHNPHYREGYQRLSQLYLQLGLYGFAEKAHQKALEIDAEAEAQQDEPISQVYLLKPQAEKGFDYHSIDLDTFLTIFSGRRDAHAKQWVDERGRWGFARVDRPLKARDAYAHVKGDLTLAVYPVTVRDTVSFIVFDVDTAKRVLLESGSEPLETFRNKAHEDILKIKSTCDQLGLALYIEDSGYKGRHGWLFFTEELPAAQAIQAGREIMRRSGGPSEGMIWELFPMGKSDRHRSLIKLPLGINRKNNRRCLFLNPDNQAVAEQGLLLKTIKKNDPRKISEVLDKRTEGDVAGGADVSGVSGHPAASPPLRKMITCCKVLGHLVAKAKDTGYLNHYERICLLYTLSFAGEEGCRLLHKVIGYCINYDYQYTQKQIERRKDSPMSCAKIMENFPELAETLPCDCKFKLPPRSYPAPVLYLLESEMESAGAESPDSEPAEWNSEPVSEAAAEGQEARKQEIPTLDFEEIFSEDAPSADGVDSGDDESLDRSLPEAASPLPHTSETHSEGEGFQEWNEEERRAMATDRKTEPPVDGTTEQDRTGNKNRSIDTEALPEAPLRKEHTVPIGNSWLQQGRESDDVRRTAGELMVEYLKLKQAEEQFRCEVAKVCRKLEALFHDLDTEELKTHIGRICRLHVNGEKSKWVLTIED